MRQYTTFAETEALLLTAIGLPGSSIKPIAAATGIQANTLYKWKTTPNHLIHIGSPIPFDTDEFLKQLQGLMDAAYAGEEGKIRTLVAEAVPTYHPAGEHGSEDKGEAYDRQMATAP